ncbi:hypothetical protein M413DRAFT_8377 [Hebeloma cylindrosporum]|uniref:Uncharacterized protein n=1 Tax=Hebeloma cylindrosporum TaxID=76867 RepID=A0A0C3CCS7_HEBCY|nr:hypothetical protein M413DRAFT_8377 [Hebeloma cylindrosporum h7]
MFPVATIITLFFAVIDAGSSNKLDRSVPLCVPTFYSPNAKSASGAGVASFSVAMIFLCTTAGYVMNGLPSLQAEVWLLAVIALPLVMGVVSLILETYNWMKKGPGRPGVVKLTRGRKFLEVLKLSVVLPVAIAIYLALKITLLILACIELGTLTHEGSDHTKLDAIRWTSFFPHMG